MNQIMSDEFLPVIDGRLPKLHDAHHSVLSCCVDVTVVPVQDVRRVELVQGPLASAMCNLDSILKVTSIGSKLNALFRKPIKSHGVTEICR